MDLEAHPVDGAHRAPVGRIPHPEVPDAHDGAFPLDGHGGDLPGIFGHREPAMVRPAQEWVKGVVDPLADEREARDEEDDGEPREETGPPEAGLSVGDPARDVVAPLGGDRRVHPDA